jgi:[ribosomal protein S5]-alanine N-acetyltransferase
MDRIEVHTNRLILKGFTPEHIHDLFRTSTSVEIKKTLGIDDKGFEYYKSMHEQGMVSYRISMLLFLLTIKETAEPIGDCGFHTWNNTHKRAELFYNLNAEQHKQKGYMSEALEAIIQYGFEKMKLHRIQAMVDKANTASVKLLQKNKFIFEGTAREDYNVNGTNEDSECYSLLKWEWEKMKIQ